MSWIIILVLCSTLVSGFLQTHRLVAFNYEKCDAPFNHPGLLNFRNFKIRSTRYGDFRVSGHVETHVNITSPVMAEVSMQNEMFGLKIPMVCIDNFGSCTYPDLCDLGVPEDQRCPQKLEERDYPCRCPFEAGKYVIPGLIFPHDSTIAKSRLFGTHTGQIIISMRGQTLACYEFAMRMDS